MAINMLMALADSIYMRISTGIAEISFNNLMAPGRASENFYVWPVYNSGRVQQVSSVARRTEPDNIYIKPSPEERERIFGLANAGSYHEYLPTGKIGRVDSFIRPGSLFEAIA